MRDFGASVLNRWCRRAQVRRRSLARIALLNLVNRRRHMFPHLGVGALELRCLLIGLGAG